MRKIDRNSVEYPDFLRSSKVIKRLDEVKQYFKLEAQERQYRRFDFSYLHDWEFFDSLKEPLLKLFRHKCAYCEVEIFADNFLLDLFRPKQAAASLKLEDASFDHYVWLAFEWNNMFLCCQRCSATKRNIFPVTGPRAPLLCSWNEACFLENNTILNPCEDEPSKHLKVFFNGRLEPKSPRGKLTIKVLELNSEDLVYERRLKLEKCLKLLFSLQITSEYEKASMQLNSELRKDSAFSGLVSLFLLDLVRSIAKKRDLPAPRSFTTTSYLSITGSNFKNEKALYDYANEVNSETFVRVVSGKSESRKAKVYYDFSPDTSRSLIKKIKIKNFKGIDYLEFELLPNKSLVAERTPCLTILGENATGKSSVLQAIALCLMGAHNRNILNLNVDDFLPRDLDGWQNKLTAEPYVEITFENESKSVLKINPLEKAFDGEMFQSAVLLSFGARRYFDTAKSRHYKKECYESLFDPLSTSSHPKYWLASVDEQTFISIARALTEIFVLSEKDKIVRKPDGHIYINAHGRETPIERLSEGYKSIFSLVMNVARAMIERWGILEEARGVVLIDEIDIHLHPRWKIRVVNALRTAFPKVQFITTTHDPLCLRGFSKDEIRVLYRTDDYEIRSLDRLPDTSSLRIEQLLTSDLFGLATTEDLSVEEYFNELAFENVDRGDSSSPPVVIDDLRKKKRLDIPIGDTPVEQIENEAIKRFLQQRNTLDAESREQLKEAAILEVLSALKSKSSKLQ